MSRKTRNSVGVVALLAAAGAAAPAPGGDGTGIADDIISIAPAPEIAHIMDMPFPTGCSQTCADADAQARQAVFTVLAEGDPGALVELLATYPHVVSLNRERSAIQVVSCTGGIFAHLPGKVAYRAAQ